MPAIDFIVSMMKKATDRLTDGRRVISTDHSYIHDNLGNEMWIIPGGIAADTDVDYLIKVPAGEYPHIKGIKLIAVGATVIAELRRNTTANPLVTSADGAAPGVELIGPVNKNDNTDIVSGITVFKGPTITSTQDGETWMRVKVPGSQTNQTVSVGESKVAQDEENVGKGSTDYLLRFSNIDGANAATDVEVAIFFYGEAGG